MEQEETKTSIQKNKKSKLRRNIVILVILLTAIIGYIVFKGDFLEISEIGNEYISTYTKKIMYNVITFGISFIILFISILIVNKGIKKGLKPFFEQEKRQMPKLPNKSIALIGSLILSYISTKIVTQKALLAFSGARFGIDDPIFGNDISFYMFQKPFIEFMILLLGALIIGFAIYRVIYYIIVFNFCFDGVDRETLKQSNFIKKIISSIRIITILVAILTLLNTQDILFDKMITLEDELAKVETQIYGAGLTDVTIKLWGYRILSIVMIISIFRAIKYFKENKTKKVIISIAYVPIYLIILGIVMGVFEFAIVRPNELDKEKQYIAYNIENTKNAYNINVEEKELENTGTITSKEIEENRNVIDNIAIVSKDITLETLKEKQSNQKYYSYRTTQIEKYDINGNTHLVYVSPREIISDNVTYNNKTYEYTHGYGSVITSATSMDNTGNIEYIQKTFDGTDNKINIIEPRIYFGMETTEPVVTNSKNKSEFDYPKSETENAENNYDGTAGLKVNFIDRLVLGIRQGNLKLAFSGSVTDESKILINRNIIKRAEKILPYVIYDENPYQVINDEGKILWVIDGYTVSDQYPYSQETTIERNGRKQKINYIRNSVKVIVDSYNGDVKFYITDRTDPIIMAYAKMYPDLFANKDDTIPEDIAKHIVYPEYLYKIQAGMLERYHSGKTDVLYRCSDVWDVATHTTSKTLKTTGTEIEPYYTMVKTVDSESEQLGLVLPYTQLKKQNLISYLVATCDENVNGKLTLYKYSDDSNVLGPMQLDIQIEQDEEISKEIQALSVTGTKLIRNMVIVPIEEKLLYVEPIYQVMLNDESKVPILKKVIIASGNKVAIGDNVAEALRKLTSEAIDIEVSNTEDEEDLINAIIKANENLETSGNNNDWEMMGKDLSNLQNLINKLEVLQEEKKKQEKENEKYEIEDDVIGNTIANTIQ